MEVLFLDELPLEETFEVPAESSLKLSIAMFATSHPSKIIVNLLRNSKFEGAFADFSSFSGDFNLEVHLKEEGAEASWHLASLTSYKDKKNFYTSAFHESKGTKAVMSNYGIVREEANLVFAGTSEILRGSKKSSTYQEAKIIVFDPKSKGRASPILKISENDVEASHAAIVGRLNEEHLFYLESRGLSLAEAKRLIALGYLKPIESYFTDKDIIERLDKTIEGGF